MSANQTIDLRPARIADVEAIMDLVNGLAAEGVMLPRSPASIVERIRDFLVAEVDGTFAGCGALAVVWTDIAEIRSIAVAKEFQGLGVGAKIAEALIEAAVDLGLARVVAFTYVTQFFERLGFKVVDHGSLPHKVFNDCLKCPKFHSCDEVAVVKELRPEAERSSLEPVLLPTPGRPLRVQP
ncbi:MAG: N-acetyltransferase [Planctomycetota bacterium]